MTVPELDPTRPRIAVLGDVHLGRGSAFARVLDHVRAQEADGLLLVGDLVAGPLMAHNQTDPGVLAGYHATLAQLFHALDGLELPYLWVPGNHDLPHLGRGGTGGSYPGNVDGDVALLAGLRVAGIGGAGPDAFGFCYEWREAEIAAREVPDCDVLLCHAPPRDSGLDRTFRGGRVVGSAAIRARALAHSGALVCGHIHESPGAVALGRCLAVNPGGIGAPYGAARLAWLHGLTRATLVALDPCEVVAFDLGNREQTG